MSAHESKNVAPKAIGWGPDSTIMRLNTGRLPTGPPVVKHGFKKLPPNSIGGIAQDWTSDLPRNASLYERAYERLIESFHLRLVDQNKAKSNNMEEFVKYISSAKKRNLLPGWWNSQCDKQLHDMAKARLNRATIRKTIIGKRGPFEPMIHRMMAEKIHGAASVSA